MRWVLERTSGPLTLRLAWAVGAGAAMVYFLGLGLDVLEADAAQYAAIARALPVGSVPLDGLGERR